VWEHNLLGARLCAKEGDISGARKHLDSIKTTAFCQLTLPAFTTRVCDLELRLLEGRTPCAFCEMEELVALHKRSRALGEQDDVVRGLCNALTFHNQESTALTLVREYLALYRRDGFPADPTLTTLAQ